MAGRKPKPTALRVAEGNPGKRPINAHEPKPRAKRPKMPLHLSEAARAEWRRVMRILAPMGIVTEAEADLLAMYADAYAHWVEESRAIYGPRVDEDGFPLLDDDGMPLRPEGTIVFSGNGTPMRNPRLVIIEKNLHLMGKCMTELGLTPSARARLVAPGSDVDPLDKLLDKARQRQKGVGGGN